MPTSGAQRLIMAEINERKLKGKALVEALKAQNEQPITKKTDSSAIKGKKK